MTSKEDRFKVSDYLNRIETDTKVFTLYGAKQLVTNDIFVVRVTKALKDVADGEHLVDGIKVEVKSK